MPIPCGLVTPGVCRRDLQPHMLHANVSLMRASAEWPLGMAMRFEAFLAGGQTRFFYRVVAFREGARLVFARCYLNGDGVELYTTAEQAWHFEVSERVPW